MSTRSFICKYDADKKAYRAIYCHFDGYVKGVGAMLDANYNTESKVNALLDLGDISSLDATVEETKRNAYKDSKPRYLANIDEEVADSDIEYVYLYVSKGLWRVYMVNSQVWDYLPNLLKAQGVLSSFSLNWDTVLDAAKSGDCYEQLRRAEQEGCLVDLLMNALDDLSESDYAAFKKRWSEVWAAYVFYKEEE